MDYWIFSEIMFEPKKTSDPSKVKDWRSPCNGFVDFFTDCQSFAIDFALQNRYLWHKNLKIFGLRPAPEPFHKKKIHFTTLEFLITTLELFSDFETFETLGTLFKTELFHSNIVIDFHNLGTALNSF